MFKIIIVLAAAWFTPGGEVIERHVIKESDVFATIAECRTELVGTKVNGRSAQLLRKFIENSEIGGEDGSLLKRFRVGARCLPATITTDAALNLED